MNASGTEPLAGRFAVVTGASGGIGSTVARRLARDGASVLVHYHASRAEAEGVVRAIAAAGGAAEAVGADLGRTDGPAALIARLDASFGGLFSGRLDILVNNAGTLDIGALADVTDDSFDRLFNLNVRACFQLAREAARRMTKAGWGRIINMGSVLRRGRPGRGTQRLLWHEVRRARADASVVARPRPCGRDRQRDSAGADSTGARAVRGADRRGRGALQQRRPHREAGGDRRGGRLPRTSAGSVRQRRELDRRRRLERVACEGIGG